MIARVPEPVIGPPVRPKPLATLVTEPSEALVCTVESGNMKPPVMLWTVPATLSFWAGLVVPIPTLPLLVIRIHSFKLPLFVKNRTFEPLLSEAKKNPPASCPNLPLVAPVT